MTSHDFFRSHPASCWVVRLLNGQAVVEETATEALADQIGPRLRSDRRIPRFRAEFRRGQWGVVDGQTPGRIYLLGSPRQVAQRVAACWACAEALRLGTWRKKAKIFEIFATREEAEATAERLRDMRSARIRAGLSLARAAMMYGASASAIASWERLERLPPPRYLDFIKSPPRWGTYFAVRLDGQLEEIPAADLAAMIGFEVDTPEGKKLRWQPALVGNDWGVVDATRPQEMVIYAGSEEKAHELAAAANIADGWFRDLRPFGIYSISRSRKDAEENQKILLQSKE